MKCKHPLIHPVVRIALFAAFLAIAPVAKADVITITVNTVIGADNEDYDGHDIIVSGCIVTINGAHAFNSLQIANSGTVSHSANANEPINSLNLSIATYLTIDAGSKIDVSGCGYAGGQGPGAGLAGQQYGPGGGHGGRGGSNYPGNLGGAAYGSIAVPMTMGSGGGRDNDNNALGGAGGGSVVLSVDAVATIDGGILANGLIGAAHQAGGGAGGGIRLTAQNIVGAGVISADGGDGRHLSYAGGGGGGRIALVASSNNFSGTISAKGGAGIGAGAAGTIYTQVGGGTGALLIDAGDRTNAARTPIDADAPIADATVSGKAIVEIVDSVTLNNLNVAENCTLYPPDQVTLNLAVIEDFVLAPGATVSASGHGYPSSSGPGEGGDGQNAAGGGHGGRGGNGRYGTGGAAYGSYIEPVTMGSGGGHDTDNNIPGGKGGGAIRINVGNKLTIDGTIASDGLVGTNHEAGGGAGGSIWITATNLEGSGVVRVHGGNGCNTNYAGGGAGGRIALYYDNQSFDGAVTAYGGAGYVRGGAGTIYSKLTGATGILEIDTGGQTNVARTPLTAQTPQEDIEILGGAIVEISEPVSVLNCAIRDNSKIYPPNQTTLHLTVSEDLTLDPNAVISADGHGYPSSEGPGAGTDATQASGGGYGGRGQNGYHGHAGGDAYGSIVEPVDFGSGGGHDTDNNVPGGAGGGAIRLVIGGVCTIDGEITAKGAQGTNYDAGGGAGGSIWITAGSFSGSGLLSAIGGQRQGNSGGGGAGGRIAVHYNSSDFVGTLSARGALGCYNNYGGAGTIYTQQGSNTGTLRVDAENTANPARTPLKTDSPLANLVVARNARVEITEPVTMANATISGNSIVYQPYQEPLQFAVNGNLTLAADGYINADGHGYSSSEGPGAGTDATHASGGGYGGRGQNGYHGHAGGDAYGSIVEPVDFGSGGGHDTDNNVPGGAGGGAIRLVIGGVCTIDGEITAKGAQGTNYDAGGGAGGSIWITAGSFGGSGLLSAIGGQRQGIYGGGGAGGRIAVHYNSSDFVGTLSARGALGCYNNYGGAGTIYTRQGSNTGTLRIDAEVTQSPARTPLVTATTPQADLVAAGNAAVEISEPITLASAIVNTGAKLHPAYQVSMELSVLGNMLIASDGQIVASGHGHPASEGPGAGNNGPNWAAGGGYGGVGGYSRNYQVAGGLVYGSIVEPADFGSGGGRDLDNNVPGGAGGGAIRLIVNGTLTVNGEVAVDGLVGTNYDAGGGAGGSIWINAGTFAGSGSIHANGGNGYNTNYPGGGAGGRIALYINNYTYTGSVAARGGAGWRYGGAGTIYTKYAAEAHGVVEIDNAGITNGLTRLNSTLWPENLFFGLSLSNGARLWVDDPMTFVNLNIASQACLSHEPRKHVFDLEILEDVFVGAQSSINVDECGYASATGPGKGGNAPHASGAGYGGIGGQSSTGVPGGNAYGAPLAFFDLGSGGGHDTDNNVAGGAGGGAIHMKVHGGMIVNGVVSANGQAGTNNDAGGGSGGTVELIAAMLDGTGAIAANGGNGRTYSGGGAGGRIAILTCDMRMSTSNLTANGGTGYQSGGAGTITYGSSSVVITDQPDDQVVWFGTPQTTLTIVATGDGELSYQWRKGGADLVEGADYSGVNSPTLVVHDFQQPDMGYYYCLVTDDCGPFGSRIALLTIPHDLDLDGDVDLSDLAQLLGHYGTQSGASLADGDIDADGDVDLSDLAELLSKYGVQMDA